WCKLFQGNGLFGFGLRLPGTVFLEAEEGGEGFVPFSPGSVLFAEDGLEHFGTFEVAAEGGAKATVLGELGIGHVASEELGFETGVAPLFPGRFDELVDEVGFVLSYGLVSAAAGLGERFEFRGVFAGKDEGFGVESGFETVETGDGLTCDRGWPGGLL